MIIPTTDCRELYLLGFDAKSKNCVYIFDVANIVVLFSCFIKEYK